MTAHAVHDCVLAEQREFCLGMVKSLIQHNGGNSFPACGAMARVTILGEAAVVGISMAIRAQAKGYPHIARFSA